MRAKGLAFDQVYDVRGLRVIVDEIPQCYQVLSMVHSAWTPVEREYDDYIARPKANGYQSLHTVVRDELGRTLEVQIRTRRMLHRAIIGSMERFIGMLIENYAGAMPPWLAPVQVAIANISEGQSDFAEAVAQTLKKQGFRVESDLRNEKITYKIRQLSLQKVPYILVVGDKEKQAGLEALRVAVRARGGADLGVMPLSAFAQRLSEDVAERRNVGGTA